MSVYNFIVHSKIKERFLISGFEQQPTVALSQFQKGEGKEEEEGDENGRTLVESLCSGRFDCRQRNAENTNSLISDASEKTWSYSISRAGNDGRVRMEAAILIILLIFVSI